MRGPARLEKCSLEREVSGIRRPANARGRCRRPPLVYDRAARFRTPFAGLHAIVHAAQPFAIRGAFGANLGARHHWPEARWFDMLAAGLETVSHQRRRSENSK